MEIKHLNLVDIEAGSIAIIENNINIIESLKEAIIDEYGLEGDFAMSLSMTPNEIKEFKHDDSCTIVLLNFFESEDYSVTHLHLSPTYVYS